MRVSSIPSWIFLALVALVAVALCTSVAWDVSIAYAEEIAILKSADVPYYEEANQGFRTVLPPRTEVREYALMGSLSRGREIAKTLRASPPTLVFAVGLKAALACKLELPDTPVIFGLVLDPESHGLPAPNMTGIRMMIRPDRQLTALRSVLPHVRRVGLLYDEEKTGPFLVEARRSAERLGLELVTMPIRSEDEVSEKLRALAPTIDVLWITQDPTVVTKTSVPFLLKTVLDTKLPMFTFSSTLVQQGALGGLVVNPWEVGRQAGQLATRLFLGETASFGQLHDPEEPRLALNLQVAEHLGLSPSKEVIRLATILYGPGAVAKQPTVNDLIP